MRRAGWVASGNILLSLGTLALALTEQGPGLFVIATLLTAGSGLGASVLAYREARTRAPAVRMYLLVNVVVPLSAFAVGAPILELMVAGADHSELLFFPIAATAASMSGLAAWALSDVKYLLGSRRVLASAAVVAVSLLFLRVDPYVVVLMSVSLSLSLEVLATSKLPARERPETLRPWLWILGTAAWVAALSLILGLRLLILTM